MNRTFKLVLLVVLVALVFIGRLLYLQVINEDYKFLADSNSRRAITLYPDRGFIYDRTGKLIVANQPAYDLMVIPRQVKPFDTLAFCELLKADTTLFKERLLKARNYSRYKASLVLSQISKEDYASLQEKMFKYPGFFIEKHSVREYPYKSGSNVLGFIRKVSENTLKKNPYYKDGDLIGETGIEKSYEKDLRGKRGVQYKRVDVHNRIKGPYKEGLYDEHPESGTDLVATIDIELQQYGEALMRNKRGSIVAIEPSTGEILALVSSPNYDPDLLVGRERSMNYNRLYRDSLNKPLFDRSLLAEYSPGSPFKTITGLIGLQEGVVNPNWSIRCYGGYQYGARRMGCHCETYGSVAINLEKAIEKSCNTYFSQVYRMSLEKYNSAPEGMAVWSNHVHSFGLGSFFGNDLYTGKKGLIPTRGMYDRAYGKTWYSTYTLSNAIGQGEILVTPMQMANIACVLANRGFYYTPHIVKKVGVDGDVNPKFKERKYSTISPEYFPPIIKGLEAVYKRGSGTRYSPKEMSIVGKTGTIQNYKRIDGQKVELESHSAFFAFAPKENPKIAIAVYVENGTWGSRWAAPIATLMAEKYVTDSITLPRVEKAMLEGSLQEVYDSFEQPQEEEDAQNSLAAQ